MVDEVKTAAPPPAAAPQTPPPAASGASASQSKEAPRSSIIRNPAPVVDPNVPVPVVKVDEGNLPASTLAEMEAGRAALRRGKPVAPAVADQAKA